MATSFLTKGPIQLDNMIVYKGPPTSRKRPRPTAMTLVEKSASRPAVLREASRPTSAVGSSSKADSDECIAADLGFSPIDHHTHHSRHDDVLDTVWTSPSGDQQMSLDWLEPLELFNLGDIIYNEQFSSELEVPGIGATPILDLGGTIDLPTVDTDIQSDLSHCGLSDSLESDNFPSSAIRTAPESRALTDESLIDAAAQMEGTNLPSVSECQVPIMIDLASDDQMNLSDDSKPAGRESADGRVASSELATLHVSELSAASREESHPTGREAGMGLVVSRGGLSDDTQACQAVDFSDSSPPTVEGEKSFSAEQIHVDESHQQDDHQRSPLGGSGQGLLNLVQPANHSSDDDDEEAPFVPGRRRRGPLSVRSPLHKQDEEGLQGYVESSSEGQCSTPASSFLGHRARQGRKRVRDERTHGDDDDVTGNEATVSYRAEGGPQRHGKGRKRHSDSHRRSQRPGRSAVPARSPTPDMTMQKLSRPSRRRRSRDYDARSSEMEEQPTWAVDRIVKCTRKRGEVFYRVKWKDTWEPATSLLGCADTAVAEFHMKAVVSGFHNN